MADTSETLDIAQLVELLATVSSFSDEAAAAQGAVEHSAQALEAEVAAVVSGATVTASVGYPVGEVPERELVDVALRRRVGLDVAGVGGCHTVSAPLGGEHPGYLVLARYRLPFTVEERNLVRGMARVLELTLTMLRTLGAEQEMRRRSDAQAAENARLNASLRHRQRLLEHLFDIQRAITRRRPLEQVLDMITVAARDMLDGDMVVLWLRDGPDADQARIASSVGLPAEVYGLPPVRLAEAGAAGHAMRTDSLVVAEGAALPSPLQDGPCAYLAAPVHENGAVTGSLVVAAHRPDRRYGPADEQSVRAFAEQISLALNDRSTMDRMQEALHDGLTGLASRKLFLETLEQRLSRAAGEGSTVALLYVDLDRFKNVNDTLGHTAGDQVLMFIADRLKSHLREHDVPGRLGGDEFAVLLPDVNGPDEAIAVAARLVDALAVPMSVAQRRLLVNASIGIALAAPGEADASLLLHRADVAMYQAKRNGRGRFELFVSASPGLSQPTVPKQPAALTVRQARG
jgi:diguanylate cyclase (GGDEF)-like protein